MAGAIVGFGGTMPADDVNGLFRHAEGLRSEPKKLHLVVGLVDVVTLNVKPRTDEPPKPVLAFRHVELAYDEDSDDGKQLREILERMYVARTGKMLLPFEPGAEIPAANPFPEESES